MPPRGERKMQINGYYARAGFGRPGFLPGIRTRLIPHEYILHVIPHGVPRAGISHALARGNQRGLPECEINRECDALARPVFVGHRTGPSNTDAAAGIRAVSAELERLRATQCASKRAKSTRGDSMTLLCAGAR